VLLHCQATLQHAACVGRSPYLEGTSDEALRNSRYTQPVIFVFSFAFFFLSLFSAEVGIAEYRKSMLSLPILGDPQPTVSKSQSAFCGFSGTTISFGFHPRFLFTWQPGACKNLGY
jgi:hypothetical protein